MVNTETDNPSFMLSIDGKPQEEYGHILGVRLLGQEITFSKWILQTQN